MSGFDEFNRILLPVLSVVAQQVLAITNAKKANVDLFQFPGDPQQVRPGTDRGPRGAPSAPRSALRARASA